MKKLIAAALIISITISALNYNTIFNHNTASASILNNSYQLTHVTERIAIIDTGAALHHPALVTTSIYTTRNMLDNSSNVHDANGHGTRVLGLLAANNSRYSVEGLIPNANYIIVKALNDRGEADGNTLANAIIYSVNQGARVILIASGISVHSDTLRAAVDYAYRNNIVIVAAAGNNVRNPQYPAAYPNAISVGAVDQRGVRAGYSPIGLENDVMANGNSIRTLTTNNSTGLSSGTSMAAPTVAALALALQQRHPNATAAEIIAHIKLTADGGADWNERLGWGTVNYNRALSTVLNQSARTSQNTTAARALAIPRDTTIAGELRTAFQAAWYNVNTVHYGDLTATINTERFPIRLDLFDAQMRLVSSNTVSSRQQKITLPIRSANMRIRITNTGTTQTTRYTLLTEFSIYQDKWEANNRIDLAQRLPQRATIHANLHQSANDDWYYVDLQERGYLHIEVTDIPEYLDPVLLIEGNNNRFSIDQGAAGQEERFIRLLEPGRYLIRVSDYHHNSVHYDYTLDISFTPLQPVQLTDIRNHWARTNINNLVAQGITGSRTNMNTFQPDSPITRAELTEMLVAALKLATPTTNVRAYRDVAVTHQAHDAIVTAQSFNVIQGYPDGTFRPNNNLTRAELAAMVYPLYQKQLRYRTTANFGDMPTHHWAYTAVNNLARANILNGYADSTFRPNGNVTRAEAATIIARLLAL